MAKNFRNNRRNTRGPRRTPRSPESKFEHILTLVAGVIFGGLTLLFLMYLVGIRDKPIECSNAPLVALIFGLCVGLSATFIGGYASAKGNFAFPIVGNNPLAVAASGGIAALLLTSLLAWTMLDSKCVGMVTGICGDKPHASVTRMACGKVFGLDPQKDGFLTVRTGPTTTCGHAQMDHLRNDDLIIIRRTHDMRWHYIKRYSRQPFIEGWAHRGYIEIVDCPSHAPLK